MRVTKWSAALLCGVALALPIAAQEDAIPKETPPPPSEPTKTPDEAAPAQPAQPAPKKTEIGDPPLHRWGGFTISVAVWQPALVGADEELATVNGVSPLMAGSSTRTRETVAGIYHTPKDFGSVGASYDAMDQDDPFSHLSPGQFIFGETRAFPAYLGAFNDGFADGVTASISRKTREFRLWYSRTAFESPRVKGTWGVGYRQVSHSRNVEINYLAIVPNLPPVIPPALPPGASPIDYQPLPDFVSQTANFSGHGLGVSLDLEFPIHSRVSVISGLAIGLIRGSASSQYVSATSYYFQDGNPNVLTNDELLTILSSSDPGVIGTVHQAYFVKGLSQSPTSQFAETVDIYVGLEVRVYRGLKLFATLRDVYYANVGQYVVPQYDFSNERTSLSAAYEGYVFGLSWRF